MSTKRKGNQSKGVGKWEFADSRETAVAAMREVLIDAQVRTKEIRATRKRATAA